MSETQVNDISFASLNLAEVLERGVADAGFDSCTPIQSQTLPIALAGGDVAGQALTGTGKTAAFLLAMFNRLLVEPPDSDRDPTQPRALIVAPTRELAVQIHRDAAVLGKHAAFKLGLVYGGTGYQSQRDQLAAGVDVLIGTPGRLIDYLKQRVYSLKAVQVVVLDEADRMFDLGFIKDIRYLLRRMPAPEQRLNMLFSATLSHRVMELAYEHMNNPEFIRIEPDKVTVDEVKQTLYHPSNEEKIRLLVGLLRHMDPLRTLVFTNTKGAAERVSAWLQANGFNAESLTGDVPQPQRLRVLQQFTEGTLPVLVATDVAARGLHIPDVSHVFNYDLPQDAEDYVHRIGRTARAGCSGDAISLACEEYAYSLIEIEKFIGRAITAERFGAELLPELQRPPSRARGHARGRSRNASSERTRGQRASQGGRASKNVAPQRSPRRPAADKSRHQASAERHPRTSSKPTIG